MVRTDFAFLDRRLFLYVLTGIAMSGYDAVATMQHIARGVAVEGNPVMDSLIQVNAVVFFGVKMAITVLGLLICYEFAHLRTARVGIRFAVVLYSIVSVYHAMIVLFE